ADLSSIYATARAKKVAFDRNDATQSGPEFWVYVAREAYALAPHPEAQGVTDEDVTRAASGIHRLFVMRDYDEPMPSYRDIARAPLEPALPTPPASQETT